MHDVLKLRRLTESRYRSISKLGNKLYYDYLEKKNLDIEIINIVVDGLIEIECQLDTYKYESHHKCCDYCSHVEYLEDREKCGNSTW